MASLEQAQTFGGATLVGIPAFDFFVWALDTYARGDSLVNLHDQLPPALLNPGVAFLCMCGGLGLLYMAHGRHIASLQRSGTVLDSSGSEYRRGGRPKWLIPVLTVFLIALVATPILAVGYSLAYKGAPPKNPPIPNPPYWAYERTKPHSHPATQQQSGKDNVQTGQITQGPCSTLQLGGSNNRASVDCAPEWHFSDLQRSRWSEFAATLPSQCAEILVIADMPDEKSHDFALDMFQILDAHHKVNRFGHFLFGSSGQGVSVQVHAEDDVNVPLAQLIISGMQHAGIPVTGLLIDPNINDHEIHIIVSYKPSK